MLVGIFWSFTWILTLNIALAFFTKSQSGSDTEKLQHHLEDLGRRSLPYFEHEPQTFDLQCAEELQPSTASASEQFKFRQLHVFLFFSFSNVYIKTLYNIVVHSRQIHPNITKVRKDILIFKNGACFFLLQIKHRNNSNHQLTCDKISLRKAN